MLPEGAIVFAGGVTGGHLLPGIAVAESLAGLRPDWPLVFVTTGNELETRLLARTPFQHAPLPFVQRQSRLRRGWWIASNTLRLVREFRRRPPRAVIGLGAYGSVPAVAAALWRRVPLILLEQNAIPGRVTRWAASRSRSVCLSFAESAALLAKSSRVIDTGNPVRREIAELAHQTREPDAARPPTMLILGGSQGSVSLNAAVMATWPLVGAAARGWRIVHQSGAADVAALSERYRRLSIAAEVAPFLDDLPQRLATTDLVIARAGATTLAELACAGVPSILVPLPTAADDHQTANARSFVQAGAARLVRQQSDPGQTATDLARDLTALLVDPSQREAMRTPLRSIAQPDAANAVAQVVIDAVACP